MIIIIIIIGSKITSLTKVFLNPECLDHPRSLYNVDENTYIYCARKLN